MEDKEIRKILLKVGISANKQGFYYILDACEILSKQKIHTNMMTIYEILANKYDKTKYQIERAIRYSIEQGYKKIEMFKKIYSKMPENSMFLYDLVFNLDIIKEAVENE